MVLDLVCPKLKEELKHNDEKEMENPILVVQSHYKSKCEVCNSTCFIDTKKKRTARRVDKHSPP